MLTRSAVTLLSLWLATPTLAQGAGESAAGAPAKRRATLDLSLGVGGGDSTGDGEPQLSLGLHLTARPGPLILAGDLELATNFFGSGHAFLTAGAGSWVRLGPGRLELLGLFGFHRFEVFDYLETPPEHELRTAGARAAWELEVGRQYAGRLGFAAACYFDLERQPDPEVGADVGGVTVLLSVALGIGI